MPVRDLRISPLFRPLRPDKPRSPGLLSCLLACVSYVPKIIIYFALTPTDFPPPPTTPTLLRHNYTKITMSFLKKPFKKLKGLGSGSDKESVSSATPSKEGSVNGANATATATASASAPALASPTVARNGSVLKAKPNDSTMSIEERRRSQEVLNQEKVKKSMDKERNKAEAKKRAALARIQSEVFMKEGPADLTNLYRPYSMNMSKSWNHENRVLFKDINFARKCYFYQPCLGTGGSGS